jgi:hypothetical protein
MVVKSLKDHQCCKRKNSEIQSVHLQQFSRTVLVRRITIDVQTYCRHYLTIHIPHRNLECSRQHPLRSIQKVPGLIFDSEIGNPEWENLILMYVLYILYSWLYRPTNAQHTYINNILYIVSTATCFDASTSYTVSLKHVLCWSDQSY